MSQPLQIAAPLTHAAREFGTVDVLVNNARTQLGADAAKEGRV